MADRTFPLDSDELIVEVWAGEDGFFIAECPELEGCHAQARTEQEALAELREVIGICLEERAESGLASLPPRSCQVIPAHG